MEVLKIFEVIRSWLESGLAESNLTPSVSQDVLQKSTPTQIRRLIFNISDSKEYVHGFVGEFSSAKRLSKHFA